jgi:fatty acid desaturase
MAACVVALVGYLLISWQFLLFFWLPIFYFGWFFTYFANYYEHFGATPGSRYADSISYYGWLYNSLFFNEGYHQEHHLRPNAHWSERPAIYQKLSQQLDKADRVILQFPPPLGFLHHRGETESSIR